MDLNESKSGESKLDGSIKKRKTSRRTLIILVVLSPFILIAVVDIVFPAIGRVRDFARISFCKSKLVDLGRYLQLYQMDYNGEMPPTLQTLMTAEGMEPKMLICPGSEAAEPVIGSRKELAGMEPLWLLDKGSGLWVFFPSGISYAYRGGDLTEADPSWIIVAYDLPDNHYDEWRNVLFLDTDVKKLSEEEFQAALVKDNQWRRKNGRQEIPAEMFR